MRWAVRAILTIFGLPVFMLVISPRAIAPSAIDAEMPALNTSASPGMTLNAKPTTKIAGMTYKAPAKDPLGFLPARWVNAAKNLTYLAIPGLFAWLFMELVEWSDEHGRSVPDSRSAQTTGESR